jgi:hypothetical protein
VPLPQCVLFASLLLPTGWIKLSLANLGGLFFLFFFSVGHPGKPSSYVRFACMPRHDWFVGLTVVGSIVQSQSSLHLPMLVQVSFPLTG